MLRPEAAPERLRTVLMTVAVQGSTIESKSDLAAVIGNLNVTDEVKEFIRTKWRELVVTSSRSATGRSRAQTSSITLQCAAAWNFVS